MSEDDCVDIEKELDDLLTKVQPNLQDVIKRSFTNVVLQQTKNGEQVKPETLEDTSYFAKNTQVNLTRLELVKSPTFHMQSLSLDLKSMALSLRCSLGEVKVRGLYSAFNENLYNLIPVMSEGHVLISLTNMTADVNVGLVLEDDAFSFINPGIEFIYDEVIVKLSWPSPQKNGGYDFCTTEQLAKHIDDLPLTAAISLPLYALLRDNLQRHLEVVLRRATSVSEVVCCNPSLFEAYSGMVESLAANGNKIVDMVLINMRRTLLQSRREQLQLPPLHATFMHKIGSISLIGKFETEAGWVKNLATINRVSDVSVTRPDPVRTCFRFTLRIKDFQIGYDEYHVKAMGVSCSGRVVAAHSRASLHAALSVGLARWEPYAQLDDLRVQHLESDSEFEASSVVSAAPPPPKKAIKKPSKRKTPATAKKSRDSITPPLDFARSSAAAGAGESKRKASPPPDFITTHSHRSMDLHITGLGPLSGLSPLVGAWVRGAGAAHAAPAVARQLQHELHVALADLPLWDMLHANH